MGARHVSQDTDRKRDTLRRIDRLRRRLDDVVKSGNTHPIIDVIKGLLDLLEDEL